MNEIVTKCPAKINLNLRILDKREDGYHNIQTHFQLIDIYDHLKFKSNKDRNIIIESQETYLNDEFNTIYQSAEKLQKLMNENAGVVIEVKKNIPTGSGLGGASSNAASTLVALNKLWRLNLNKHDLIKIASSIGADVPFFVYGKNASGEGIGDKLEENKTTSKKILVIKPNIHSSTKKMFNLYDKSKNFVKNIALNEQNSFWGVFLNQNPNIEEFIFSNNLENKINLSGSGSSLFIYYEEESDIDKIIKKIPRNWRLFFCKPLQYSPICNIN